MDLVQELMNQLPGLLMKKEAGSFQPVKDGQLDVLPL